MENYRDNARGDAIDMALNFIDEIVEHLIDSGEASDDLFNNYTNGDSYHHENHVDKWYELKEAAEVLDQLSDDVETDSGLWQGLEPERAIGCMAAYTYGNAVYSHWRYIIERINDMDEVTDLLDKIKECEDDDESEKSLDDLKDSLTNVVRSAIESV